jgi:hypothetical protein
MLIWKQVPSYPWILASNTGLVRSTKSGVQYSQCADKRGYLRICTSIDGCNKLIFVHRLVCEAFHGPSDLTVEHKDKCTSNNNETNLCWLSLFKNQSISHAGENNPMTNLTNAQVMEIRRKRFFGISYKNLMKEYDISKDVLGNLLAKRTWSTI